MSIPSININLNLGAEGVSNTEEGQAPTPVDLSELGLSATVDAGAPAPAVSSANLDIEEPPAPSEDMVVSEVAASDAGDGPPPADDIPGLPGHEGVGSDDDVPEPEGEPEEAPTAKKTTRRK